MLVLSRKKNETIEIDVDECEIVDGKVHIEVVVIGLVGNRVRLGVDAPPAARIHRGEVVQAIRQREATQSDAGVPA